MWEVCIRPLSESGTCVDDIAFLHSMTADSPIHGSAMLMMNSGSIEAAALHWFLAKLRTRVSESRFTWIRCHA